ncbi:aromatic amino acid ammonia-lyase [Aspergillus fijiensis CBS 313.89]|uniref:Putative phenylalanine ammonia-lyase n=1 Tax=Aspergillus fijiensis CBS 313.89 TaxID=1448319 RepID=A0A8G1RJ83_9EURO|nr:putative phenylalanine ammonia-lyase [Aspergillus fijiensis CBS 313.89]RAK71436.1 putative phenylalanine ammonia-lyase [Aspergillus fijiensis CBS 313.89]
MSSHLDLLKQTWALLDRFSKVGDQVVIGEDELTLAAVVAVSRASTKVSVQKSPELMQRLVRCVDTMNAELERGGQIYGVNTGCGGNANTRTSKLQIIQHSFFQHHQAGILPQLVYPRGNTLRDMNQESQSLSPEITRGTILLRCNSLLRGHSAVRIEVIDLLLRVLSEGYVPLIPLRGSISASGDLSPLSYVGGLVEGNADVFVRFEEEDGKQTIIPAADTLQRLGLDPLKLNAKEGLGIMNGTAVSTAAAGLALYDCHQMALLAQVLTAMATEALLGTVDNYHEFIARCRPHYGQTEVARNIRGFLRGSALCHETDPKKTGLVQDGYSLRTAPQWIGPHLEDLMLAARQIDVELNSTTDNPLIDVEGQRFHHGGNFQAASVTSAMEKCRSGLVMLGKMIQGQCEELTNPSLSRGLPANLALDDPSLSFTVKGLDINMTAYYSELAFLSNSISNHVHSAEMNNQSVNSLALVAARYTGECVQVLSMMYAAHLYILCQALDIRALSMEFFAKAKAKSRTLYQEIFAGGLELALIDFELVWTQVISTWDQTGHLDLADRCNHVAMQSFAHLLDVEMREINASSPTLCGQIKLWKDRLVELMATCYDETRQEFIKSPSTCTYLGEASKAMYQLVRCDLEIPLHQGISDHPPLAAAAGECEGKRTIGSYVSRIYVALREARYVERLRTLVAAECKAE